MKVLIDTNILISAALSSGGTPFLAYAKAVTHPNHAVVCEQNIDELFYVSRQPVTVSKVFKGEALSEGDEIYLTSSSWRLLVNSSFRAIERGYVNIMKPGAEYLVFISEQVGESNDVPVYSLNSVSIVAPVFCYEDSQNVILPVPSGNTYVPYKEVQGNEFFVTSQESLDMILALKDEFIQKYPMSEQP